MDEGASATAGVWLPEELVIKILSRLPAKSLCRFKCVFRSWRRLIADPAVCPQLAGTLSGFFFPIGSGTHLQWRFVGLSPPPGAESGGSSLVDPAPSFLPRSCYDITPLDSCNGLLLLLCSDDPCDNLPPSYVVCNPSTGEWFALLQPSHVPGVLGGGYCKDTRFAALGFDPSVSSHFHVFQLVQNEDQCYDYVEMVEIYSSETGTWASMGSRWSDAEGSWDDPRNIFFTCQMTFLNGFLHLTINGNAVASVDTKGQSWRVTHVRDWQDDSDGFVGHSQGRLIYLDHGRPDDDMAIYVLEDHNSEEWTFKQSISKLNLFGPRESRYSVAGFHPDSDLVYFYDWSQERILSYDMNLRDMDVICSLGEVSSVLRPFLPYTPLYSEALATTKASQSQLPASYFSSLNF